MVSTRSRRGGSRRRSRRCQRIDPGIQIIQALIDILPSRRFRAPVFYILGSRDDLFFQRMYLMTKLIHETQDIILISLHLFNRRITKSSEQFRIYLTINIFLHGIYHTQIGVMLSLQCDYRYYLLLYIIQPMIYRINPGLDRRHALIHPGSQQASRHDKHANAAYDITPQI